MMKSQKEDTVELVWFVINVVATSSTLVYIVSHLNDDVYSLAR